MAIGITQEQHTGLERGKWVTPDSQSDKEKQTFLEDLKKVPPQSQSGRDCQGHGHEQRETDRPRRWERGGPSWLEEPAPRNQSDKGWQGYCHLPLIIRVPWS